jgi:hypothetical protein
MVNLWGVYAVGAISTLLLLVAREVQRGALRSPLCVIVSATLVAAFWPVMALIALLEAVSR